MNSRTAVGPLGKVLGAGAVRSAHVGVVQAPLERVWEALVALRWTDLRIGRVLMKLRGLGRVSTETTCLELFTAQGILVQEPPRACMVAMIGKPWSPVPRVHAVASLEEFTAFNAPGWLKYGMEWCLTVTDDGRTLVETRTLCQPTSRAARLCFNAYWSVIKAGSSLIRRELIAGIRVRAEAS
ncbi:MAG: hypothetical protein Q4D96_12485 [Propionibacteriaceae bacterium]|nr:hypothetical protein [Propionibacteriaceae bacterium]